tara:strand:- start:442 stop:1443 length:1002 start_codon:yes stop_codon:yes gene_type:complete
MKSIINKLLVTILIGVIGFVAYSNKDQLPEIAERTKTRAVEVSESVSTAINKNSPKTTSNKVVQEESNYETTDKRLDSGYKPIVLTESYEHDKWITEPQELVREFRAFIVSFDDNSDNVLTRNPDWVAYEMRAKPSNMPDGKAPNRPSKWIEDDKYNDEAPNDKSYLHSGFHRGHLCMKHIAWRLGANADWNTHTTINASPQHAKFNTGVWLDMENKTKDWADEYGRIWVICGGAYKDKKPSLWIGDEGEEKVAVPEYFWKIVIRLDGEEIKSMAFMYPHKDIKKSPTTKKYFHARYLTSINDIETLTGLDFLTKLEDEKEEVIEALIATEVW